MAAVLVLVTAGILIARSRHDDAPTSGRASSAYVRAAVGLCDAQAAAAAGDAASARSAFFNFSHQALHDLARRLEDGHRDEAARLLLAKQAVEADLARAAPADVARDLGPLLDATRRGVVRVEGTRLAPCSNEGVTP